MRCDAMRCLYPAPVENLKCHDRANGVVVGAVVPIAAAHTERTTRIGVEVPRAVVVILRRRPNELIGIGRLSAIS